MRLEQVTIRNLGPFRGDFTVDFQSAALRDAKVVAICGANGAGKSTLLELGLPGGMYRSTPTRGTLAALATARDSCLETRIVNGKAWTIRHVVDVVSGKGESVVLDADGAPVLPDSKVKSYDSWAAAHLPSPEVLYSTVFQAQGAAGFLGAKPAERKALLLRILGVERLEHLAELARERGRTARSALDVAVARLADEQARCGDVAAAERDIEAARQRAAEADAALDKANQKLAFVEAQVRDSEAKEAEARAVAEKRARLTAAQATARQQIADLETRIANNRALIVDKDAIESAIADVAEVRLALDTLTKKASVADLKVAGLESDIKQFESMLAQIEERERRSAARAEMLRTQLTEEPAILAATAQLPQLRMALEQARADVEMADDALKELRGTTIAGAESRIAGLRKGLIDVIESVADYPDTVDVVAQQALDTDNDAVSRAAELPRRICELDAERDRLRKAEIAAEVALATAERKADRAQGIARDRAELDDIEQRRVTDLEERRTVESSIANLKPQRAALATGATAAREQANEFRRGLVGLEDLASKAPRLAQAEARIAELEPQLATAQEALRMGVEELLATPGQNLPAYPSLEPWQRAQAAAVETAKAAHAEAARAEQRLEQAQAGAARLAELEPERTRAEAELADWNRLSADLGKDGLQALEIDAAGPELTALVNDLLHSCHGPRFTVRVDTQRLASDGKRMLEGCDVVVLDTRNGREASGETFSGGERVVIGEALSLALSMLAIRRQGVERPTIVRDESGAALDPENARVYVAMLRRAAELVGADKVLFVSHSAEVQELADARIDIGGAS